MRRRYIVVESSLGEDKGASRRSLAYVAGMITRHGPGLLVGVGWLAEGGAWIYNIAMCKDEQ